MALYLAEKAEQTMLTMMDEVNRLFVNPNDPRWVGSIFHDMEEFLGSQEAEVKGMDDDDIDDGPSPEESNQKVWAGNVDESTPEKINAAEKVNPWMPKKNSDGMPLYIANVLASPSQVPLPPTPTTRTLRT